MKKQYFVLIKVQHTVYSTKPNSLSIIFVCDSSHNNNLFHSNVAEVTILEVPTAAVIKFSAFRGHNVV
jgi:hypothetical protein